ncbi:MAG: acyl-CoA thioesterase [Candidatus Omnitrophica bacterium]|nr:acyl-CoA thioesterase [Candidatus Omnitrophota bacterium]
MKRKVYYHHTDCGKVVYYANYLHFLEEARTEFLQDRGIDILDLMQKGKFFVVARQQIDYHAPARYGDILEITTKLICCKGVRIELEHTIKKEQIIIAEAKTTLAFVDSQFKLKPLPEDLVRKLQQ